MYKFYKTRTSSIATLEKNLPVIGRTHTIFSSKLTNVPYKQECNIAMAGKACQGQTL
jgi:hypothetical protein